MLRSCCTSSAAALGSVRQALGTSATGGFGFCSSGAGWGTGCFCRLDRMRSLAAKPSTQRPRIKESNRCFLLQSKLCLARFTQHFQSQAKVSAKYHCQGWRCRWSLEFGSARKLARSALFPTGTEPLSHRTACAPRPHIPATVPTDDHSRNSWCKTAIKPDWPVTVTADKLRQTHLLPLHDLRQSVRFVLGWERGQIHFLLLQSLIIEPHGKHSKQSAGEPDSWRLSPD